MGLGLTLLLVTVAGFVLLLGVLYRRQRMSRGGDTWVAGQERYPRVGEVADTNLHSGDVAGGPAGIGGGS
jgi:hypothetical protein